MASVRCSWCLELKGSCASYGTCAHAVCKACRKLPPTSLNACRCCKFDRRERRVFALPGAMFGEAAALLEATGGAADCAGVVRTRPLGAAELAALEAAAQAAGLALLRGTGEEEDQAQLVPAADEDTVFLCKWGNDMAYHLTRRKVSPPDVELLPPEVRALTDPLVRAAFPDQPKAATGAAAMVWLQLRITRDAAGRPVSAAVVRRAEEGRVLLRRGVPIMVQKADEHGNEGCGMAKLGSPWLSDAFLRLFHALTKTVRVNTLRCARGRVERESSRPERVRGSREIAPRAHAPSQPPTGAWSRGCG